MINWSQFARKEMKDNTEIGAEWRESDRKKEKRVKYKERNCTNRKNMKGTDT